MNDPCLHSLVPAGIIYMYFDFKCSRTRSQLVYDSGMRSGESLGSSAGRACLPARRLSSRSVCSFTVPACLPQSPARRNPPPPLPRSLERTLQPPCRIRTPLRPINRIRPGAACSSEVDVSVGAAVSGFLTVRLRRQASGCRLRAAAVCKQCEDRKQADDGDQGSFTMEKGLELFHGRILLSCFYGCIITQKD